MEVEAVAREALAPEAARAAVLQEAPELEALLGELRASLAEVRTRVGPLLREVLSQIINKSYLNSGFFQLWLPPVALVPFVSWCA